MTIVRSLPPLVRATFGCSGHKHHHGGNIQFLSDARGEPVWVSEVEPGSTADITAARLHAFPLCTRPPPRGW
ncbi:transposase family protein [Nocardiopsis xinjiangensis]|uniref:transposase family protein n=1 Tax=Nocardiopsis xinjiangensis TaxID=124285 RepID=UPI00373AE2F6